MEILKLEQEVKEKKGRVLIVDDDEAMLVLLRLAFREAGWEVEIASRPDLAQKVLAKEQIDLVVVDIQLNSIIDGFQFVRSLRGTHQFRNLPVVFLTGGNNSNQDVLRAKFLGASAYVLKPIRPVDFVQKISEVVN